MALHKIIFDPTDADSRAGTHTVGAVLYDKANDRLGVINASNQLEMHDADVLAQLQSGVVVSATDLDIRDLSAAQDNVAISDGTDTLAVNGDGSINSVVTATDLDIRDISHTSDSIQIGDGTDLLAVNADGSINSIVSATDLDIRDLDAVSDSVAAWISDGAGNAISSTGTSLDVNVTNSIDVDDGLANTAIKQVAESVGTSAAAIVDGADELASRKYLFVYNNDSQGAYIGDSGVTTANGFPVPAGAILEARIGAAVDVYMIGDKAAMDIRTLQLS